MAGKMAGLLATLKKPSTKYSLIALLAIGFFSGVIFWLFEIQFKVVLPKGPIEAYLGF